MKILKFKNTSGSINVDYLTDLVGSNENFTVYQVTQWVSGVQQVGLTDALISAGFFHQFIEHNVADFILLAKTHSLTLTSIENTATGSTSTVLWGGSYGNGGAIGSDQL